MLFFRSEEHVRRWCDARALALRPIIALEQLWHLAVTWYANRLTVESRRPAPEEMVKIFSGIGLRGPVWDTQADQWKSSS